MKKNLPFSESPGSKNSSNLRGWAGLYTGVTGMPHLPCRQPQEAGAHRPDLQISKLGISGEGTWCPVEPLGTSLPLPSLCLFSLVLATICTVMFKVTGRTSGRATRPNLVRGLLILWCSQWDHMGPGQERNFPALPKGHDNGAQELPYRQGWWAAVLEAWLGHSSQVQGEPTSFLWD